MMQQARIEATSRDGFAVLGIQGEVDLSNAADVAEALYREVPQGAAGVVIDLSGLRYIDSRGVLLLMQLLERLSIRRQRARLVLPDMSPLYRLFTVLSVTTDPGVDPTVDAAVRALQARGGEERPAPPDGREGS